MLSASACKNVQQIILCKQQSAHKNLKLHVLKINNKVAYVLVCERSALATIIFSRRVYLSGCQDVCQDACPSFQNASSVSS